MNINISVETAGLSLITSGFLFTQSNVPVTMTVLIDNEKTLSLVLFIHPTLHSDGKSMVWHSSDDGSITEWHVYESEDGEAGLTPEPIPVVYFDDNGIRKTITLQLHTKKLLAGMYRVEYIWLERQSVMPAGMS